MLFFFFTEVRNQFVHLFHFVFMLSQKPYNQVPEKALEVLERVLICFFVYFLGTGENDL